MTHDPKPWVRLARNIYQANRGTLTRPFKLTYVVTKECHSRCVNCSIWQHKPQGELTLEEVERFARNTPFLSWIDFTGGEPTDRPDFVAVVETFLRNCPDLIFTHFPTNGLNPERAERICRELVALKPRRLVVTVSIDGPPSINDALRGIKGDFESATKTLRLLRAIPGMSVYAGMTLYPKNASLVDETISAITEKVPGFQASELHLNVPHRSSHYYGNDRERRHADPTPTDELIGILERHARKSGMPMTPFAIVERMYRSRVEAYVRSGVCPQDCAALLTQCYLSENGTVYPCTIWDEPIGNIRDSDYSLMPWLASDRARELRERLLKKDCPNCWTPCEAYTTLAANLLPGGGRSRAQSIRSGRKIP